MSLPLWFRMLPRAWRRRTYTSRLGFKPQQIAGLVFKIADRRAEWEQAFRLLHDVSVQAGYYQPKASGMRVAPCHAVPSTAVFVALKGDEVVGTMTLVEDSPLGVPMETIFAEEVNRYRVQKRNVAEVSALAKGEPLLERAVEQVGQRHAAHVLHGDEVAPFDLPDVVGPRDVWVRGRAMRRASSRNMRTSSG